MTDYHREMRLEAERSRAAEDALRFSHPTPTTNVTLLASQKQLSGIARLTSLGSTQRRRSTTPRQPLNGSSNHAPTPMSQSSTAPPTSAPPITQTPSVAEEIARNQAAIVQDRLNAEQELTRYELEPLVTKWDVERGADLVAFWNVSGQLSHFA